MKDFYQNAVLQLLFIKSTNLIQNLTMEIFSYIFHKNIFWDRPTTNKLKNKKLRNWNLRGYSF